VGTGERLVEIAVRHGERRVFQHSRPSFPGARSLLDRCVHRRVEQG
jgi:hypothetical protein